jgi:hypothetical protein
VIGSRERRRSHGRLFAGALVDLPAPIPGPGLLDHLLRQRFSGPVA